MKNILKEDTLVVEPDNSQDVVEKVELPADIVTGQVSAMWAEIGNLKQMIANLNSQYLKSGRVVAILQDLLDAYLVAVGQLELHLHDNNFLGDSEEDSEDIADAAKLTVAKGEEGQEESAEEEAPEDKDFPDVKFEAPVIKDEIEAKIDKPIDYDDTFNSDFPDPVGEKLTDEELYPEQKTK